MQQILDWLNDPTIKTILLYLGGFLIAKWPGFIKKFVPLALLVASIILAALNALFPVIVPAAHAFLAQSVSLPLPQPHQPWWHYVLFSIIVPVLAAVGAHSSGKNTLQALKLEK